jgi:Tol biopolymer transport system component
LKQAIGQGLPLAETDKSVFGILLRAVRCARAYHGAPNMIYSPSPRAFQRSAILWAVFTAAASTALFPLSHAHASDDVPTISYSYGDYPSYDIHTMKINGTEERALTSDGRSVGPGGWSPDGQQIVYAHGLSAQKPHTNDKEHGSQHSVELCVMNRDGSNPHTLLHREGVLNGPEFSPDGKTIIFNYTSEEEQKNSTIRHQPPYSMYSVNADGSGEPKLLKQYTPRGKLSTDGKMQAFLVLTDRLTIHVANADGSNDHLLVDPATYTSAEGPAWSPDGRRIAFAGTTGHQMFDKGFMNLQGIFTAKPDGSDVRQIAGNPDWFCGHPSWSPKGDHIAYSCLAVPGCSGVVSSNGTTTPRPPCVREMFVISLKDPNATPVPLGVGVAPEFSPR